MGGYDSSIDAFLIGAALGVFMTGITSAQAFRYFRFGEGSRAMRLFVGEILFLDIIQSAVSVATVYGWGVTDYGKPAMLAIAPWTFAVDPMLTGIVGSAVQAYFAHRLYLVGGRRRVLPALVMVLSTVQLAFATAATARVFQVVYVDKFVTFTFGVITWLTTAACADLLITFGLIYYLRKNRISEYDETNSIIDSLLRNLVQTNGITTIVAIINACVFASLPFEGWHAIPTLVLLKFYFNSLLVSLNSRLASTSATSVRRPSIMPPSLAVNVNLANLPHAASKESSSSGKSPQSPTFSDRDRTSRMPLRVDIHKEVHVDEDESNPSVVVTQHDLELGYVVTSPVHFGHPLKPAHW